MAENAAGAELIDVATENATSVTVDNTSFEVAGGKLKLKADASLDFEAIEGGTIEVVITASGDGESATHTVTVTVTDVSEDLTIDVRDNEVVPVKNVNTSLTIDENTVHDGVGGAPLALIEVTAPDATGATTGEDGKALVTLSDTENFQVILDPEDGLWLALTADTTFDFETGGGSRMVTVTYTDTEGNSASKDVTVTVNDVNEDPTISVRDNEIVPVKDVNTSLTIDEGTLHDGVGGPPLALIEVMDVDAADQALLTGQGGVGAVVLTGDQADKFAVILDPENGLWLALRPGVTLDHEVAAEVPVTVTFTDSAGNMVDTTVTVTVNNANEAPAAPSVTNDAPSVNENDKGTSLTAVTGGADPEGGDVTYHVNNTDFEIVNGVLQLTADASLDHEAAAYVMLEVTAMDAEGASSPATMVTVRVNDLNEAPHVVNEIDAVNTGIADTDLVIPPIHLEETFADQDDTDSLFTYELDGGPDDWDLKLVVETVTYTATAPTVADAEFEYTPPMAEEEDGMGMEEEAEPMATPIVQVTFTDPDIGTAAAPGAVGRGDEHTYAMHDDRFEIDEMGMLSLKAGLVLTEDTEVMVAVTDRYGLTGTGTVSITIAVEEEEGDGMGDGDMAGDGNGDGMEEEEETPMPDTKDVTFITGTVTGKAPAIYYGTETLAIVATDDDGASGRVEFDVVVDDGNDVPTAVKLANNDGTDNVFYQVEVDENSAGAFLGSVSVDDIDSPDHPHGQHEWKVDNEKFEITDSGELKLIKGMYLDHEAGPVITIRVTATDKGKPGLSKYQDITVTVNDKNDAPVAIGEAEDDDRVIGNWWVTINERLDAEDALKGQWLSFSLEGGGDDNPAFEDEDAGDKLTFSITSGPAWLEIDPMSGKFTNKAEMIAAPGKYYVTVRATDEGEDRDEMDADGKAINTDGAYTQVRFMIAVAESDANDDGVLDDDNDEPTIRVDLINSGDYTEGSGKVAVARVTVTDEDFGLAPHPFGVLKDDEPILDGPMKGQFELSKDYSQNGNARTWTVYTKATNTLNHEAATGDDIEIIVTAYNDLNGNEMLDDGEGDQEEIDIDVEDANEAPVFAYPVSPETSGASNSAILTAATHGKGAAAKPGITVVQGQQEAMKTVLYVNLMEVWDDPDDDDDVDELTFGTPTASASWIKVLNFGQWEDIKDGPDGDEDDVDDDDGDDVAWGRPGAEPGDDDWVVIVEIDRMTNNGQTDDGAITLTARDEGGMSGSATILVDITDENVQIPFALDEDGDATEDLVPTVKINGALREGNGLTMSFNHRLDPDFAAGGAPLLVEYTWTVLNEDGNAVEALTQTSYGYPSTLRLTQDHVGMEIQASVMYYELTPVTDAPVTGEIVAAVSGGSYKAMGTVSNVQDTGTAHIVYTTSGTMLQAEVNLMDEDGIDTTPDLEDADNDPLTPPTAVVPADPGTPPVYTWQESANGFGGWSDLTPAGLAVNLGAAGGSGKYYRLVITYTDEGGVDERIEGDAVKVGKLATPTTAPTVTGSAAVGGTLIVDSGAGSVQWQREMDPDEDAQNDEYWVDIADNGNGQLTLTNTHAGMTLRALVTYKTGADTTAVVAATQGGNPEITIAGGTNVPPVSLGNKEFTAVVMPPAKPAPTDPVVAVITKVEETVDVASLFQDANGDKLTYTTAGDQGFQGGNYLRFDANTGKLLYITDNQGSHDDGDNDGGGNVVAITVTANDGNNGTVTSMVSIRLNVAPTAINGADSPTSSINETASSTAQDVATLNVQDENSMDHEFGSYEWTVSDDRFEVTPDATDGSMGVLKTKAGKAFPATGEDGAAGMVKVTVTATDEAGDHKITQVVTIVINNTDDTNDATTPEDEDPVPGLKDDDTGTDDTDEGDDKDTDGGLKPPPPPAMSFEDDLLDEYVLAIDDMDIA